MQIDVIFPEIYRQIISDSLRYNKRISAKHSIIVRFANVTNRPAQPVLADQRGIWQERSVIRGKTVISARVPKRPKLRQTKSGYFVFEKLKSRRMHAITRVFTITYIVGRSGQYRPWFVQIWGAFRPDTTRSLCGTNERNLAPFALVARARAPGFAFHSTSRHWNIIIFVPKTFAFCGRQF